MNATIFVLSCLVIGVVILILVKPKAERMNRRQKKIYRDAIKRVDELEK